MEDDEMEVIEVSMNDDEINEFMEMLRELKENKESLEMELADDLSLVINYEENDE